jgi:hypothetical protein
MQEKFDEEKSHSHKEKEQLLAKQLEVNERANIALQFVKIVEVQTDDQVTQQVA